MGSETIIDILVKRGFVVKQKYLEMIVDKELDIALRTFGAILIEGPKWCGKTTTAENMAARTIYLQDIRSREQNLQAAKVAPDILLKGETPRLIDERQTIPKLWDGVRFEVDQRRKKVSSYSWDLLSMRIT